MDIRAANVFQLSTIF